MKQAKKTLLTVILILFIGNINLGLIFAGNSASASFSVSCYMPYYVTMPNGEKVLAENQQTKQETIVIKEEKEGNT